MLAGVRRVVIVVFDGVQSLDVTGPAEVFAGAGWAVRLVSRDGAPVRTSSGITIVPDGDLASARGAIDVLVVAGGEGTPGAMFDTKLTAWLRRAATRSRYVTSVCSGAFVLAEAGLLDGRRATTHWRHADLLAERYPAVQVTPDVLYVEDGPVITSACTAAGIDACLHVLRQELGAQAASAVARRMVVPPHRDGGQAQYIAPPVSTCACT